MPTSSAGPHIWCDVEVPHALGEGLSRWDCKSVSWRDRGVRYPNANFAKAQAYTKQQVERTCGLKIEIREDQAANIESFFVRLDGPNGVLARQWLPGTPSRCSEQRRGEWDRSEASWIDQDLLNLVTFHEFLHGLGLGHYSGAPSVMNPSLNREMIGVVDSWTRDQLVLRYDEPGKDPTPDPTDPGGKKIDWQTFCRKMFTFGLEILGE